MEETKAIAIDSEEFPPPELTSIPEDNTDNIARFVDSIYDKALVGAPPVSKPIRDVADEYLAKYGSPEKAAAAFVRVQLAKCGATGFVTGVGGILAIPALPAAVAADISGVFYVQMRMIAAIAHLGGADLNSDRVRTLVYLCLAGRSIESIAKDAGLRLGRKGLESAVKKIPMKSFASINRQITPRIFSSFGSRGLGAGFSKLIPGVGGVVSGGFDMITTKIVAKNAIELFIAKRNPEGDEVTAEEETLILEQELKEDDAAIILSAFDEFGAWSD